MSNMSGAAKVRREFGLSEHRDLLDLTARFALNHLEPTVDAYERSSTFPRELFLQLGAIGLLNLPYSDVADSDSPRVPYVVSLQVIEELASSWLAVGLGVSVHHLACAPLIRFGSAEQRDRWQSWILNGDVIGAYCLSEPHSGSDAAALSTRAIRDGDSYVLNGTKSWITHGGVSDFYTVFARTGEQKTNGISCFFIPAETDGLEFDPPESKMALNSSPTTSLHLNDVRIPSDHRIGQEGQGFSIALSSLDIGRLGISACAVGLAQSAFQIANSYSQNRLAFGQSIADFQGIGFMLADMATGIHASRCVYTHAAALLDTHATISLEASISKLLSTDTAMQVTTDAVQVLGGNGYTTDFRVERLMREAKVLQIVEGTNQIQRVVISRELRKLP